MTIRLRPAAVIAALCAGLVAVPACKKKDDGGGIGLSSGGRNQSISQNNLKQIGLGLHNMHDSHGALPLGVYGPDGKTPGLSWRVAILPYVEQDALYKQFKLDEPWDSAHNKKLIAQMPKVYAAPDTDPSGGQTFYRGFGGEGALFNPKYSQPGQAGKVMRGPTFSAINNGDGLARTAMVVEAAEPVVWTKPGELEYKPGGPLPKLGGIFRDGANVVFADGSVYFLKTEDLTDEKLKAIITVAGGEPVKLP